MTEDAMKAMMGMVEKAYVRLQAGDLLVECIDQGSSAPMHAMVEGLVLEGPQALDALREVHDEVISRKSQIQTDIDEVFSELEKRLKSYGIFLGGLHSPASLLRLEPASCLVILEEQKIEDEGVQMECLQHILDSVDLIRSLTNQRQLIEDVDNYLSDWLWVLIYQSAQQELANGILLAAKSKKHL